MNVLANELSRKSYRRVGDGRALGLALGGTVGAVAVTDIGADVASTSVGATCGVSARVASGINGGAVARFLGGRCALAADFDRGGDGDFAVDLRVDFGVTARGVSQLSPASGSAAWSSDNESKEELPVDIDHHWRKGPDAIGRSLLSRMVGRFCSATQTMGRRRRASNVLVMVAKLVLAGK